MIRCASHYYIDKLMTDHSDVKVNLRFMNGLIDKMSTKAQTKQNLHSFTINIDCDMGVNQTLRSIAHEMVHVKQFAQKQLIYHADDNLVYWRGDIVSWNQQDLEVYYNSPWEVEANGREIGLYEMFKIHWRKIKRKERLKISKASC